LPALVGYVGPPTAVLGPAAVAVGHLILVIAWHLLTDDADYSDVGGDYFSRGVDPDRRKTALVDHLQSLGYAASLRKIA